MMQLVRTLAVGALGVALAAGLMALIVPAQAAPARTAEQMWQDVQTFEYLHALTLTAAQARQAAELAAPVNKLALDIEARGGSPEVLAALAELRAAALAGKPITEDMYKKVTMAKAKAAAEWTEQATPTIWAAAENAAKKLVPSLSHDQQLAAAHQAAHDQAQTVVTGALGQAEADAEAWKQWVADTQSDLAASNTLGEGVADKVAALLEKAHGVKAEDADAQSSPLADELTALLVAPANDEQLADLAAKSLSAEIVANRELADCLREYADAAQ